jgi:hypothetical protein
MTKVNIKLTSFYNIKRDKFEFYSGDVKIDNSPSLSEIGFKNLKKFAIDVLFEVAYYNLNDPRYRITLSKGEGEYLGDFRIRYSRKPLEEEREELIRNLNNKELNKRAKGLAKFCLKDKKSFENE